MKLLGFNKSDRTVSACVIHHALVKCAQAFNLESTKHIKQNRKYFDYYVALRIIYLKNVYFPRELTKYMSINLHCGYMNVSGNKSQSHMS
jgi:hypothetical protein